MAERKVKKGKITGKKTKNARQRKKLWKTWEKLRKITRKRFRF